MFIVWNFGKESLDMIKTAAAHMGEEAKEYNIGCFNRTPAEKPITEVIFMAHGSRNRFGGSNEEDIGGLSPNEFVKTITTPPRQLPNSVKDLCLCGCHIGLAQPPNPSYIARVAEELAKHPDYRHVIVRGVQVEDYESNYSHLLQTHHLDEETNKQLIIDYYPLTHDEYDVRKQFKEAHTTLVRNAKKMKSEIEKLEDSLSEVEEKSGRKNLLKEEKNSLSQIEQLEKQDPNHAEKSQDNSEELNQLRKKLDEIKTKLSVIDQNEARKRLKEDIQNSKEALKEIEVQMLKKKEDTRTFRKVLSTPNIKDELMKEMYIVTPFAAEKQRAEMTKLKQAKPEKQPSQTISKSTPAAAPQLSESAVTRSKRQLAREEEQQGKKVNTIVDEEPPRSSYGRLLPMLGVQSPSLSSSIPAAPGSHPQSPALKPSPPKSTASTKLPLTLNKNQPILDTPQPAEKKPSEESPPPSSSSFKPSI